MLSAIPFGENIVLVFILYFLEISYRMAVQYVDFGVYMRYHVLIS